jgi:MoxR-like ATPase
MHMEAKLDFWIKEGLNVIFVGKHGVGKTTMVKEAFERNNLKWLYFSSATMDPWVDFIGVPKEKTEGELTFLELVRPKYFQTDEIEALFFDEFNRSHKKVRNAVMELIQFKSINGKKFNNLKIIWAAVNPDDEEDEELKYDVEKIDPAQLDRFHIHIKIPYKPHYVYFKNRYGNQMADAAIEWCNN